MFLSEMNEDIILRWSWKQDHGAAGSLVPAAPLGLPEMGKARPRIEQAEVNKDPSQMPPKSKTSVPKAAMKYDFQLDCGDYAYCPRRDRLYCSWESIVTFTRYWDKLDKECVIARFERRIKRQLPDWSGPYRAHYQNQLTMPKAAVMAWLLDKDSRSIDSDGDIQLQVQQAGQKLRRDELRPGQEPFQEALGDMLTRFIPESSE